MPPETASAWSFGPFTFDPAASLLSRDGEPVKAEPQSLRLLDHLICNRDRIVTRNELIETVWDGRAVSDWAVSAAIKALRTALGDTGRDSRIVRTIHSRGFRFIADVTAPAEPTAPIPSVFVRCFRTTDQNTDDRYLAEGMTEDLITDLARQNAFGVLSYTAARAIGDAAPPASAGVTHVVEGSLRRNAAALRLTLAILDATGSRQIWAERYDMQPTALLAAQDRLSQRIIDILAPGQATHQPRPGGTRNPEAQDRYLKGRYAYFRYQPAAFADALEHFAAAAEIDPDFADAWAQQAYCRTTLHVFGLPGSDASLAPAEALARQAIALDDRSALGHARLGWVLGYCGRPDETVAAFERAVACDPDQAEVYLAYGETMNRLAAPAQAEALLDIAFSKDTYFPPSWEFTRGHAKVLLGHHTAAIGHFRAALDRVERFLPARVQLTRALWEQGDTEAARAEVRVIRSHAPKYSLAHAARMFPYPVPAERDRLMDALTAAGMT